MLDVVLAPARPLASGTDVPGRVLLRQGGSAANTARWLARLGARATLVTAVGRDREGRALVDALRRDGVDVKAARAADVPTGRVGVLVDPTGERSFVADRGAADRIEPSRLRPAWFDRLDAVHMPIYSLLGEPLGRAGRGAIELARRAGVPLSLDLSSIGPLMARGRQHARQLLRDSRPALLFATAAEAEALLGKGRALDDLLAFAPAALIKRGPAGSVVLVDGPAGPDQFAVATRSIDTSDTTGAGDAFDAGALLVWASVPAASRTRPALLRRAALSGHRAAARLLRAPRDELLIR